MKILILLAVLALPFQAEAAPKWLKRTVEVAVYAAPIVTAALAMKGGMDCRRRNGVEPCTAHYGSFAGVEGARFGVAVTFSGLSMYGHKAGFKEWFAPAVGVAAFNAYWWRHEEGIRALEVESFARTH